MTSSNLSNNTMRKLTEWDIFRNEQIEILKLRKKITGITIQGKGNVMKYIGEQWRKKRNEAKIKNYIKNNSTFDCSFQYKPKYPVVIVV